MGFPGDSVVKNPPAMQEMQVRSLGQEDPLEKAMATRSSILCLENPIDRGAWRFTVHRVRAGSDLAGWQTAGPASGAALGAQSQAPGLPGSGKYSPVECPIREQ